MTRIKLGILFLFMSVFVFVWSLSLSPQACSLTTHAQEDNPCLSQEATISAQEILLLQSTLDALNYQATIQVLEAAVADCDACEEGAGPAATPVPGMLFKDIFEADQGLWVFDFASDFGLGEGSARFAGGQLVLNAEGFEAVYWGATTGVTVNQNYRLAVDVTPGVTTEVYVGFFVGDAESGQFHLFGYGNNGWAHEGDHNFVRVLDNTTQLLVEQFGQPWQTGETLTLALESRGNVFTFFVNHQEAASVTVVPYGSNVGLAIVNRGPMGTVTAAFDNFIVSTLP